MIAFKDLDKREQVFSYRPDEPGEPQFHVAVDRLITTLWELNQEVVVIPVDKEFAEWCKENRGVEQHRLNRLTQENIDAASPLVMCDMPDGSHLMVDGVHRFVWLAEHDIDFARAWLVPVEVWERFLIKDFPDLPLEYLKNGWSGIP